ncbi:MAG: 16S rRNA (adenine(1518)-N(6)/adenine(1519)-N(6))-dimethyltransferase RsmA [Candidatus Dormibacteria bacterium]
MAEAGTRARRTLSQNFLVDRGVRDFIAELARARDLPVLEVGPGPGTLTLGLARAGQRVIALELDPVLAGVAAEVVRDHEAVEIRVADALKVAPGSLFDGPYQVVANLPYHLTGLLLPHFTGAEPAPERLVLLLQREVAQRLAAPEGRDWSLATLALRLYGTPRIAMEVPAEAFDPVPRVRSAVLEVVRDREPAPGDARVLDLARELFRRRRKQLRNSLAQVTGDQATAEAALARSGIEPSRRPETLGVAEWERLSGETAGRGHNRPA